MLLQFQPMEPGKKEDEEEGGYKFIQLEKIYDQAKL